jgi:GDPmannose 4,6-dehydratase
MTDGGCLLRLLKDIRPDEIYNLAGQSHVGVSFAVPESTLDINTLGVCRLLEAVRNLSGHIRLYQASSSEMFGNAPAPQNEDTPHRPCSPYGASKSCAYWLIRAYRDSYGLHASNGILFNHESPWRGQDFVTRKITRGVAAIEAGHGDQLRLGNLDARRDWGHARDYVEGMWLMLQQDEPDDYVLATGETRSVREFVEAAFTCIGIDIEWQDAGLDEKGIDAKTGTVLVSVDPKFLRPNELHMLVGDATKARRRLGWQPHTGFPEMVKEMVDHDRQTLRTEVMSQ